MYKHVFVLPFRALNALMSSHKDDVILETHTASQLLILSRGSGHPEEKGLQTSWLGTRSVGIL